MGLISNALGYGTAAGAQGSALNWGATSTAVQSAGAFISGVGQAQEQGYRAQVAANNSRIMQANAGATLAAGEYAEAADKLKTGQFISAQKAQQGANGLDVSGVSQTAVRTSAATVGAMDAAMIHYNAQRAAYGQEQEAATLAAQSKLDRMGAEGDLEMGALKATSTLIGGAASVGAKYAGWQQYANPGQS